MSESFEQLFNENLGQIDMRPGTVFDAEVLNIDKNSGLVMVSTPLKSQSYVNIEEFKNAKGELQINLGDVVPVALEAVEDGWGETRVSRLRAKRQEAWDKLNQKFEDSEIVQGMICGKVKGGFTVDIDGIRAFLPGSLFDTRPVKENEEIENQMMEFKVIKLDQKRNNVVISRRAVLESESSAEKEALLATLEEGQLVKGKIKNLTDYGAFVDLGGVDGLLHITDISWKRVKHPSEVLTIDQDVEVKVLRFDKEKMRVSLGLKQIGDDPWAGVADRYPESKRVVGRVTNIADYGCFVELEEGIEGLVHVSEMDWTNRNIHPNKVVEHNQEVEVMILDVDGERRRISLGLKQCQNSPWEAFSAKHSKGDKISGKIKSITDFGIFIGLDGGIDGLVHLSDISWADTGEEAVKAYKKGQELEAVVLAIDPERERISLGIKQLDSDPYSQFLAEQQKGSVVKGKVIEVDEKGALVELTDGVEGYIKATDISKDEKVTNAADTLKVGSEVEAKFMGTDRKNRVINLSIKARQLQEENDAIKEYTSNNKEDGGSTLGDMFDSKD